MAALPEIQAYLIANATGFKQGSSTGPETPIFLGDLPAEQPNRAVALYQAGGLSPEQVMNSTAVSHERPSIQVLNRSTSYAEAEADAKRIFRTLNGVVGASLSGTNYISVSPIQSPFDLRRDSLERQMFSCNYSVRKEES